MNFSSSPGTAGATNLTVLWEDGDRVFCRGVRYADGRKAAVLAVLPAAEHPTAATLDRLAHEYELKDALDGAWAVRPLELVREHGQIVLLLEDTKSEPMDRLFGELSRWGAFCGSLSRSLPRSRRSTGAASSTRTSSPPISW